MEDEGQTAPSERVRKELSWLKEPETKSGPLLVIKESRQRPGLGSKKEGINTFVIFCCVMK